MPSVIERFKACYANFSSANVSELSEIYAPEALFIDPVHQVVGVNHIKAYFTDMTKNLVACRFVYLHQAQQGDCVFIQWNMLFKHQSLARGREIVVPGVSRLKVDQDLIVEHEDFYDMGAMVYEQLPLFGRLINWLRRRMASTSHNLAAQPLSTVK